MYGYDDEDNCASRSSLLTFNELETETYMVLVEDYDDERECKLSSECFRKI